MEENNLKNILSMIETPEQYNINTKLEPPEKDYLLKLFKNNDDIIIELHRLAETIIFEHHFETHIIPHIIFNITQIYHNYCCIFNNEFNTFNIIKFTSEIVILIAIPSLPIEEIIKLNRAIDVCIDLVKIIPTYNYKKKCISLLGSCGCVKRNKSI